MYFVFIVLAFIFAYSSGQSNEQKYIDLLPEAEKQAFLEKVARRLVNGVKTRDSRYKSSEELSEEELNRHSAFVKQVLQEESGNLRRDLENNRNNSSKDPLSVKGIETERIIPDAEDTAHVDLTLRQGPRVYRDVHEGDTHDKIPVKTIYDNADAKDKRKNIDLYTDTDGGTERKQSSGEISMAEDIQVRGQGKPRSIDENPIVDKNSISKEATKIVDYDPEDVTENNRDNQKVDSGEKKYHKEVTKRSSERLDSLEYQNTEKNNLVHNEKGFSVPIYVDEVVQNSEEDNKVDADNSTISQSETSTTPTTTKEPVTTTKEIVTTESLTTVPTVTTTDANLKSVTLAKDKTKIVKKRSNDGGPNDNLNNSSEPNFKDKSEDKPNNVNESIDSKHAESNNVIKEKGDNGVNNHKNDAVTIDNDLLITTDAPVSEFNVTDGDSVTENFNKSDQEVGNVLLVSQHENNETNADKNVDGLGLGNNSESEKPGNNSAGVSLFNKNNLNETEVENIQQKNSAEQHNNIYYNVTEAENNQQNNLNAINTNVNETPKLELRISDNLQEISSENETKTSKYYESEQNITDKLSFAESSTNIPEEKVNSLKPDTQKVSVELNKNDNDTTVEVTTEYLQLDTNIEKQQPDKISTEKNEYANLNTSSVNETKVKNDSSSKSTLRIGYANEYILTTTETNALPSTKRPPIFNLLYFQKETSNAVTENKTNVELLKNVDEIETQVKDDKKVDSNIGKFDLEKEGVNLKNLLEALRQGIDSENKLKVAEENLKQVSQQQQKRKEYVVYEIPEDEPPFLRDETADLIREQPYYVPVYNYSPNNAYYNPYNRLGPNEEENGSYEDVKIVNKEDEDFVKVQRMTSGSNEADRDMASREYKGLRKFKFSGKKIHSGNLNTLVKVSHSPPNINLPLPIVVKKPKFTEIYFNPDEYLDMDYYFGRSNNPTFRVHKKIPFVDSAHYLMANNHAKTHIHAVRQILFNHRHFGYVPNIEEKSEEHSDNYTHPHLDSHHPHYVPSSEIVDVVYDSDDNKLEEWKKHMRLKNNDDKDKTLSNRIRNPNLRNMVNGNPHGISIDYYFGVNDHNNQLRNATKTKKVRVNDDRMAKKIDKRSPLVHRILDEINLPNFNILEKEADDESPKNLVRNKRLQNDIDVNVNVLRDMIEMDNKALVQFDWVGSTVDIVSAITKLRNLTNDLRHKKYMEPLDQVLLKHFKNLHKSARYLLNKENGLLREKNKKKNALPRNPKKPKEYLKGKGLIHRAWLVRERKEKSKDLHALEQFLDDLQNSLYNLHNAIKHVGMITRFKQQRWYQNIKEIYLRKLERKLLLEVIIHIYATRLFDVLENTALSSLHESYLKYLKNNRNRVKATIKDFVFLLKVLKEYKREASASDYYGKFVEKETGHQYHYDRSLFKLLTNQKQKNYVKNRADNLNEANIFGLNPEGIRFVDSRKFKYIDKFADNDMTNIDLAKSRVSVMDSSNFVNKPDKNFRAQEDNIDESNEVKDDKDCDPKNSTSFLDVYDSLKNHHKNTETVLTAHKNKKEVEKEKKEWKENAGNIQDLLKISDTTDVFEHLEKYQKLKLNLINSRRMDKFTDTHAIVNVLKDMLENANKKFRY